MIVLALDPGTTHTGTVLFDGDRVLGCGHIENSEVLVTLEHAVGTGMTVACEKVACMGMAVGKEVFETVYWTGRFDQVCHGRIRFLTRGDVKMHLCGSMRAKDANIRQALLDRFGGDKKAKGTKKEPGPLYGVSGHCWSALAVAVTARELV